MIDLTQAYKESDLITKNANFRVVECSSIRELVLHYEEVSPCYAYVQGVKFRVPKIAYPELIGQDLGHLAERKFILQDRDNKEWCWADDYTSCLPAILFGSKIKKEFSDHDVLSTVFGKVNFHAAMGGPVRHMDILWYWGKVR